MRQVIRSRHPSLNALPREGIRATSKWLAERLAKHPDARRPLKQALASAISLDATRAYAALSQVEDPVFQGLVLAEMAQAALAGSSPGIARQWAGKITDPDLNAELIEELPPQSKPLTESKCP